MTIGKRVLALRKALHLDQKDIATLSKNAISQDYISRVEKGKNAFKGSDRRELLATALQIHPSALNRYLQGEGTAEDLAKTSKLPLREPKAKGKGEAVQVSAAPELEPSPLESAVPAQFDSARHTLQDLDAARMAARRAAHWASEDTAGLGELARSYLDAARWLRIRKEPPTPEAIGLRLSTLTRVRPVAAKAMSEQLGREGDAELRKLTDPK